MSMEPKIWFRMKELLEQNKGRMRACEIAKAMDWTSAVVIGAARPGMQSGELAKELDGRDVVYALQDPTPPEFYTIHYADGEVDLHGVLELEAGGFRLTRAMVQQLRERLGPRAG